MTNDPDQAVRAASVAYVDATAAVLGLSIAPWRDGVLGYFALASAMYAVVERFPLDVHDESGERFEPIVPPVPA